MNEARRIIILNMA